MACDLELGSDVTLKLRFFDEIVALRPATIPAHEPDDRQANRHDPRAPGMMRHESEAATMELPILVAIISMSGSLLGTVMGGVIVIYGNITLAKRKEKLEFRTACRLIATELQIAELTLGLALKNHCWWRSDEKLATDASEQYRHILAPQISYDAWSDVWLAVRGVNDARALAAAPRPQGSKADVLLPETENALNKLVKGFERARIALMPHGL